MGINHATGDESHTGELFVGEVCKKWRQGRSEEEVLIQGFQSTCKRPLDLSNLFRCLIIEIHDCVSACGPLLQDLGIAYQLLWVQMMMLSLPFFHSGALWKEQLR
jgi:hypothetical protein